MWLAEVSRVEGKRIISSSFRVRSQRKFEVDTSRSRDVGTLFRLMERMRVKLLNDWLWFHLGRGTRIYIPVSTTVIFLPICTTFYNHEKWQLWTIHIYVYDSHIYISYLWNISIWNLFEYLYLIFTCLIYLICVE